MRSLKLRVKDRAAKWGCIAKDYATPSEMSMHALEDLQRAIDSDFPLPHIYPHLFFCICT